MEKRQTFAFSIGHHRIQDIHVVRDTPERTAPSAEMTATAATPPSIPTDVAPVTGAEVGEFQAFVVKGVSEQLRKEGKEDQLGEFLGASKDFGRGELGADDFFSQLVGFFGERKALLLVPTLARLIRSDDRRKMLLSAARCAMEAVPLDGGGSANGAPPATVDMATAVADAIRKEDVAPPGHDDREPIIDLVSNSGQLPNLLEESTRADLLRTFSLPGCATASASSFDHTLTIGFGAHADARSVRLWIFDSGPNRPRIKYEPVADA